ncbi:MAG: DUF177 domain-containing protein [Rhodobacteraceae bacterium]|nr:DUF177 domain-containing protein [Paracoccaceae bacterium]
MSDTTVLKLADLPQNRPTDFDLSPGGAAMKALCAELGLSGLRKLRLRGRLRAVGRRDWHLEATLGATVVQPCTVTLQPVTTRIDAPVERRYLADMPEPESAEIEMPEDDTAEPLPAEIDLSALLGEALALNLPLYPRSEGAELGEAVYTAPGRAAMRDADARPFAGLAVLKGGQSDTD